ncbi:MAG: PAS domain-containing protein, partial [Leptothrix sp. (in: b-proteobacteria)]
MFTIKTHQQARRDELAQAQQIDQHLASVLAAAARGDFSRRAEVLALPPQLASSAQAVNQLLDQLHSLRGDLSHMSAEHAAGDIDVTIDARRHPGGFGEIAHGINTLVGAHIAVKKLALSVVAEFGRGHFDAPLAPLPGKKAFINEVIETVRGNLKGLIAGINHMSAEHERGDIDVVIDAERFGGDFGAMAHGINQMVGAHIAVKKLALDVVAEFGRGHFDAPLAPLPGKKAFINAVIETVRGNLKGLVAEINHMSTEHEAGDIDVVIEAERFGGDFGTMARGINQMVGAHIAVKKLAMGVVAEFGRGHYDAPLAPLPGKKAFINDTIETVRALLRSDASAAAENLRIRLALEDVPSAVMIADADGIIRFTNKAVMKLLRHIETDLRAAVPSFDANQVMGANFDQFHRNAAHQRNLLGHLTHSHRADIPFGPHSIRLVATPLFDAQGTRTGAVLE